jgi:hypothetical protein
LEIFRPLREEFYELVPIIAECLLHRGHFWKGGTYRVVKDNLVRVMM